MKKLIEAARAALSLIQSVPYEALAQADAVFHAQRVRVAGVLAHTLAECARPPRKHYDTMRVWRYAQGWQYEALWTIDGMRVRINFKRDSYDEQSYMRAQVWSEAQCEWNWAANAVFSNSNVRVIAARTDQNELQSEQVYKALVSDEERLIKEVQLILTGAA